MPGYTNVPKPTSSIYTGLYPEGKQIYDQVDVEYDQSSVAYDTIANNYTNISKPTSSVYSNIAKPT